MSCTSSNHEHHNRIVLLFDLDCFYAQCERVRLGLDIDCKLALLQWNSVLAVTYPAREFGIKRGDSWEDVANKSERECWSIHLHVLEREQQETEGGEGEAEENNDDEDDDEDADLALAYDKIYKLTGEEQLIAQRERGVRRFYHEGKACLERYRIASMRIFSVVLESLMKRLGKDKFTLERASIDEFYLDITDYCYDSNNNSNNSNNSTTNHNTTATDTTSATCNHKTVVVGSDLYQRNDNFGDGIDDIDDDHTSMSLALEKACNVSQWIRSDVWTTLGFTMSAGISTNKMMAKLAASYGKPNGQGVLHPKYFYSVMKKTKIRKVRNFGGKLGKSVIQKLLRGNDDASMGDVAQLPLPLLRQNLSPETAQFVFLAARGIDREAVKETTGALVKSITAFKSFTATSNRVEIDTWLGLLAGEIVTRVTKDTARNKRYPKSCTLNYTYYTTQSGQRPRDGTHRSQRNTRSLRLDYPMENHPDKVKTLREQAMDRLLPIIVKQPLRGVGLSACNFETRGQKGVQSIDNFFSTKKKDITSTITAENKFNKLEQEGFSKSNPQKRHRTTVKHGIGTFFNKQEENFSSSSSSSKRNKEEVIVLDNIPSETDSSLAIDLTLGQQEDTTTTTITTSMATKQGSQNNTERNPSTSVVLDMDMELAKKLQASYDRENYILTTASRRKGGPAKKKARRIDTFFSATTSRGDK